MSTRKEIQRHLGLVTAAKRYGRDPEPHRQDYLLARLERAIKDAVTDGLDDERRRRAAKKLLP